MDLPRRKDLTIHGPWSSKHVCLLQGLLQRLREGPKRPECHPMATEEKVFNSSPAVDEQYADIDQQERLRMGLTHSASSVGPQQEGIIMAPQLWVDRMPT